ncbi:hypothetical protein ACPCJU_16010 [Streptomyces thermodiastaticus]|uniref:hypothetical protein n=1 Tax=Streptomyces TaxID=1883 RepID=UPI00163C2C9A|nr:MULTISPECIES: hypothetical protein [Streptomyces]
MIHLSLVGDEHGDDGADVVRFADPSERERLRRFRNDLRVLVEGVVGEPGAVKTEDPEAG